MRAELPSKSPTVGLNCASAIFIEKAIAYGASGELFNRQCERQFPYVKSSEERSPDPASFQKSDLHAGESLASGPATWLSLAATIPQLFSPTFRHMARRLHSLKATVPFFQGGLVPSRTRLDWNPGVGQTKGAHLLSPPRFENDSRAGPVLRANTSRRLSIMSFTRSKTL